MVGFNARPIACSLKKAGATVYVSDYWGDTDLGACCDEWLAVLSPIPGKRQRQPIGKPLHEALVDNMLKLTDTLPPMDYVLVGSGFDDHSESLVPLDDAGLIVGNNIDGMKRARDRTRIAGLVEDSPVRLPNSINAAMSSTLDLEFPLVFRPIVSGGGSGIRLIRDQDTLDFILSECEDPSCFVLQEYVSGIDVSCSVLCTGRRGRVLSIQGQLIGMPSAGLNCTFVYCGNYIPVNISATSRAVIEETSSYLCEELDLVGSNGLDYVVNKQGEPLLMEINPRLQGSLEMLEISGGISLSKLHVNAVFGGLPEHDFIYRPTAKMIVYARSDSQVQGLTTMYDVVDKTPEGVHVKRGDPICAIIRSASTVRDSYSRCIEDATRILSSAIQVSDD